MGTRTEKKERAFMSYHWCHGPKCHTYSTQDRVRGVKGSKVLRTRKIKLNQWNSSGQWGFFCSNHCQNDFWKTYATQIVAIAPRTEALETPINVTKEVHESTYWGRQINTKIEVDNTRTNDIG